MPASFSDWLTQEVEPKARIIAEFMRERFPDDKYPLKDLVQAEVIRLGISPFHYWLQNVGGGAAISSFAPSASLSSGAGSLSQPDKDWLLAVGIAHYPDGPEGQERYKPDSFLGPDLYKGAADRLSKIGFRWSKLQKAFVKQSG